MMLICGWVIAKGVSGGIEKFNKVLIPGFLLILFILMIRALTLPGSAEGVKFFLEPDFSKLDPESVLIALGHAFFSLSLGFGCMLTYGAYVEKKQSLGTATLAIAGGDLVYALIAGLIVFPTVFSFGLEPGEGVGLAFMAAGRLLADAAWFPVRRLVLCVAGYCRADLGDLDSGGARRVRHA
ncbi:hypothetical protein LJK88_23085 [Paenibacillus sp. P26]|nr:hypothetical protein LJK88_23085 [Paenibacillus sp. P26]